MIDNKTTESIIDVLRREQLHNQQITEEEDALIQRLEEVRAVVPHFYLSICSSRRILSPPVEMHFVVRKWRAEMMTFFLCNCALSGVCAQRRRYHQTGHPGIARP